MILGYASFGHKGVIFPLLVRAIGVLGSIIKHLQRQGRAQQHQRRVRSTRSTAGSSWASIISVVGFVILGFGYLHFNKDYYAEYPQALGGAQLSPNFNHQRRSSKTDNAGLHEQDPVAYKKTFSQFIKDFRRTCSIASQSGPTSASRVSTCARPGPA